MRGRSLTIPYASRITITRVPRKQECLRSRHDRQQQCRGTFCIVVDRVGGGNVMFSRAWRFPGIQISIEPWEIAAGNLQSQDVSLEKHVACRPQVDGQLVYLSRVHKDGFLL